MIEPFYDDGKGIVIYCCDCREILGDLPLVDCVVTDPPFGISYNAGFPSDLPRSIQGDEDTSLRDFVLEWWNGPAIVFGSWKVLRPRGTRMVLIWDTKGALGMGDLSLPWKPSHQEIYVIGGGFTGKRTTDVLSFAPVQSMACNGRRHPHEKPIPLLRELIGKCFAETILDPFMGSGTTLRAAKDLGRKCIGIEIEEKYCEIAAERLRQEVLAFTD